jgi:electron transport complex protein RnfG
MKEILKLIGVLTAFGAVAGLLLAYTNDVTRDRIATAKQAEKLDALRAVLPEFDNQPNQNTCRITVNGEEWTFFVARKNNAYTGAATESASKNGYGSRILLMIGFNANRTVQQVKILEQTETPGLGSRITEDAFRGQFTGRKLAGTRWAVRKDSGDFEAITGATISSRAVVDAVKKAVDIYQQNEAAITKTGQ